MEDMLKVFREKFPKKNLRGLFEEIPAGIVPGEIPGEEKNTNESKKDFLRQVFLNEFLQESLEIFLKKSMADFKIESFAKIPEAPDYFYKNL